MKEALFIMQMLMDKAMFFNIFILDAWWSNLKMSKEREKVRIDQDK